jgi:hypothetical protein
MRKIVQIISYGESNLVALLDNGDLWELTDNGWKTVALPPPCCVAHDIPAEPEENKDDPTEWRLITPDVAYCPSETTYIDRDGQLWFGPGGKRLAAGGFSWASSIWNKFFGSGAKSMKTWCKDADDPQSRAWRKHTNGLGLTFNGEDSNTYYVVDRGFPYKASVNPDSGTHCVRMILHYNSSNVHYHSSNAAFREEVLEAWNALMKDPTEEKQ